MADVDIVEVMMRGAFPHLFDGTDMFPRHRPAILKQTRDEMCAALSALTAKGFAVVPVEPNEAMKVSGGLAFENAAFGDGKLVFEAAADAYRAMLAASSGQSPTPPTQTGEK